MAFGLSAGAVGLITAGVGAGASYLSAKSQNKALAEAQTKANEGDPRKNAMLYGENGQPGLLSNYQNLGAQAQSPGLQKYGNKADEYLGNYGQTDMQKMRDTASIMQGGGDLAGINAYASGNMVKGPSQNNIDLSGSYNRFINGDAGANPYLTKALQGGLDQSTNQFQQMQGQATDNLMKNVLPSIRSNSVLSGQYGGSRQGIAEGNAIGDFGKAQQQAMTQFGQNNTNAFLGAQAQSFNQGQDRALQATQSLGAQQYGTAQQNALTQNQAEFMNVNAVNDVGKFNAQLSGANRIAGLGAQQGLLNQTIGGATNQDNYSLNRAGMTNGLLAPYLSNNPAQQVAPQSSVAGSALGGAAAGLGLYNAYNNASKPPTVGSTPSGGGIMSAFGSSY